MKVRKAVFTLIFTSVIWCQHTVLAQQTPQFPEYNYNPFLINPAYAGMAPGSVASASHSRYTRDIEGAPKTSALSIHTPLARGKMGWGAAIMDDKVGVTSATSAVLAYSYKIFFDLKPSRPYWEVYDENVFSFAMTAGVRRIHENLLELGIEDDPLFADNLSETIPVIGAGILYNKVGFYLGVSTPDLFGGKLGSQNQLELSTPVYGYTGYRFFTDLYKEIMITPSALVKYEDGAPLQLDLNLSVNFKDKLEFGAGYRTTSSANMLIGLYPVKQLRLVYHYTVAFRRSILGNSHGLALSYAFGYDRSRLR
ncbi:PorP/SprF family type IX secretion system membrane protein [Parapedobacter sp. ISTM3]|uniref:PorP/SprF family type IX secretion system membrane protein n=1 Tax=Parapedobacter sp. ISTM3 TaxID=2800130 RepID=UPI0019078E50|nr:PorP/SprF family type IX secretion system membrane protein [Parapedobacter sp. ISTM3]MBK1440013.1 PorP/SprF family type IX secretion system membrane protein [Parapedobacter sp. ISTM3]